MCHHDQDWCRTECQECSSLPLLSCSTSSTGSYSGLLHHKDMSDNFHSFRFRKYWKVSKLSKYPVLRGSPWSPVSYPLDDTFYWISPPFDRKDSASLHFAPTFTHLRKWETPTQVNYKIMFFLSFQRHHRLPEPGQQRPSSNVIFSYKWKTKSWKRCDSVQPVKTLVVILQNSKQNLSNCVYKVKPNTEVCATKGEILTNDTDNHRRCKPFYKKPSS